MKQILITGCYRSGTEYFVHLLNTHPKISLYSYATNYMRYYFNRYGDISLERNYRRLINDAKKIIYTKWNIKIDEKKILSACINSKVNHNFLYSALIYDLYDRIKKPYEYWGEKTQLVWTKVPDFLKLFPNSKVIIVIRDPRDVLCSFKKITNAPKPLYLGAIFNSFDVMKRSIEYKKIYPNNFMYVKYENLITAYENTMESIFAFLNLEYNIEYFKKYEWKNLDGSTWKHNSAFVYNNHLNFIDLLTSPRWKSDLKEWEIEFCQKINKKYMEIFDYAIDFKYNSLLEDENLISLINNEKIWKYYLQWKQKFIGIEEFPSDPLNPKNWNLKKNRI